MSTAEPARELAPHTRSRPAPASRARLHERGPRPGVRVLEVHGEIDLAESDAVRDRMIAWYPDLDSALAADPQA